MAHQHLSHEEFFTRLSTLIHFVQEAGHGAVHLSQKRLTFDLASTKVADDPLWDTHPPNPLPILVRATNGKGREKDSKTKRKAGEKTKLSTVVQPEELEAFFARYAEVCKSGMQSLKKRDRSKRKKEKGKKKKGGAEAA